MLIYLVTNKINGRMYIGQTVKSLRRRSLQHINDAINKRNNMYLCRALRKYSPDNFDWEIIHDGITNIDDLNKLEIFYIGYYNTFENGYNLNIGGNGNSGWHHLEESKKRIGDSHRGEKSVNYGVPLSEKAKENLSIKLKGKYAGKNNPMYGKQGKESANKIAVIINNQHFDTRKEAAEFLGVNPATIRNRILHKTKWLDYSYAI